MSPLMPLGLLLAGVGALALSLSPRVPYAAVIAIGVSALTWLGVALLGLALPAQARFSLWAPASLLPVGLVFETDGLGWLLALALGTLTLATLLTGLARPGGRRLGARAAILLLAFGGLAALWAANLITLVMAWAGLDFIYFAILILLARGEGVQPQAVLHLTFNSLGTLFALGAIVLLGRQSPDLTWAAAQSAPGAALLMTLAAVFRLGLFPLHLGLPVEANVRVGLGALLRLVPAAVALAAVARLIELRLAEPAPLWLTGLGVVAVFIGGLQLWNSDDPRQGLTYVVIAHSGLAWLTGLWSGAQALTAVTAQALTLLFGGSLIFLANGHDEQRRWLSVWPGLGAAVLAGFPLTVGFFGLNQLVTAWAASGRLGLWLALGGVLTAQALLTGGLLRAVFWPGDPVEGGQLGVGGYHAGLGLLALGALAGGVTIGGWGGLVAPAGPARLGFTSGANGIGLALTLAAAGVGALLWRFETTLRGRFEGAANLVVTVTRLAWLYRLVWGALSLVDRLMFNIAGVLEGEGALLWALAVALVMLLLFRG